VKNNPLNLTDPTGHLASTIPGPTSSQLGDQIAGLQLDSAGGNFGDGGADSFSSVNGEINSALLISFFSDGSVQLIPMTPSQLSSLFSATPQNNSPLSSITVLGNKVGITYGSGLTDAQRLSASDAIAAAAGVLNKNASSLTADQTKAIGQISSFSVVGPKTDLGATGKGSMTLSIGYIGRVSAPWLGSLFAHEGQHYLNAGKYSGANLWRDEQSAGRMQLGIGNKIGFSSSERQHLEQWIDDRNRAAMQQHMERGYQY
jgi:hypothetical protein